MGLALLILIQKVRSRNIDIFIEGLGQTEAFENIGRNFTQLLQKLWMGGGTVTLDSDSRYSRECPGTNGNQAA